MSNTDVQVQFDQKALREKLVLSSEEASFLISGKVLPRKSAIERMSRLYRNNHIKRVPDVRPYTWVTSSIEKFIENGASRRTRKSK